MKPDLTLPPLGSSIVAVTRPNAPPCGVAPFAGFVTAALEPFPAAGGAYRLVLKRPFVEQRL